MTLAIDPGVTTGFATEDQVYQIKFSNHLDLFEHLKEEKPEQIIYEAFHWRQGQANAIFLGVEYIGVIELWSQMHSIPIAKVNPSDGKGFWDNRKMKALGLWVPGLAHGMDAMRILLTHKMKTNKEWFNRTVPIFS